MQPTMKEEGMAPLLKIAPGLWLFRYEGQTDRGPDYCEVYAANKGHASSGFSWRGTDWEFCGSFDSLEDAKRHYGMS